MQITISPSDRTRPLHEDPRIHARRWFLLAMMCLSLVLVVMSVSGLVTAIPTMQEELGRVGVADPVDPRRVRRSCSPARCSPPVRSATASAASARCSPASSCSGRDRSSPASPRTRDR